MRQIALTKGMVALVDEADFHDLNRLRWYVTGHKGETPYARRHTKTGGIDKTILMHREILSAPKHLYVDHINGNGLDNRRCNLRLCTNGQNQAARKHPKDRLRGVSYRAETKQWRAVIVADGIVVPLGQFPTAEEAARTYDFFALAHWGAFARPNFPAIDRFQEAA